MSKEYISTREEDPRKYQFTEALLTSTASDGGLLVPEDLPTFSLKGLYSLCSVSYQERVKFILNSFQPNLDSKAIDEDVRCYGENFDHPDIAPIIELKRGQYILELWHGPTAAFKDMALQLMPRLFSRAVALDNKRREQEGNPPLHYLILVATSGDTGKAALEGYKDVPYCSVVTFFPNRLVSKLQELQMATQEGGNVAVYAMRGDFDAVQTGVKDTFGNAVFGEILKNANMVLSSANSINWGRIVPQIAYHVSGYVELMRQGIISPGSEIDIAVPTGNFGNLLSAFYAKQMGLPVGKLICASNENNVLTEFLQNGVYNIRDRLLVPTPSPSMDILVASNVERLLYAITGDPHQVSRWMRELKANGLFVVDEQTREKLQEEFYAGWVSNEQCLANIGRSVVEAGYLMDPHTSVAQAVTEEYLEIAKTVRPVIICSTAHWAKFPIDVRDAIIGGRENLPETLAYSPDNEFDAIRHVKRLVPQAPPEPQSIAGLEEKPILHRAVVDATAGGVEGAIVAYLRRKEIQ